MIEKRKAIRCKAILQAAKDEACSLCDKNNGTTVFCHLNESWAGKGIGQKADDIVGFFGCDTCHRKYDQFLDGGIPMWMIARAMYRTWRRLWERGIIGELKK